MESEATKQAVKEVAAVMAEYYWKGEEAFCPPTYPWARHKRVSENYRGFGLHIECNEDILNVSDDLRVIATITPDLQVSFRGVACPAAVMAIGQLLADLTLPYDAAKPADKPYRKIPNRTIYGSSDKRHTTMNSTRNESPGRRYRRM